MILSISFYVLFYDYFLFFRFGCLLDHVSQHEHVRRNYADLPVGRTLAQCIPGQSAAEHLLVPHESDELEFLRKVALEY